MGSTFKITDASSVEFSFADVKGASSVGSSAGRFALTISTGAPLKDYAVWHVPGTKGNVVCDLGYNGQTIIATAIYVGGYSDALNLYETDKLAFNAGPCTIVDAAGRTHSRCRLKDSREQTPHKGYSVTGDTYVFFTVSYVFDQHGYDEGS